ncbi:MAG: hypothetical protein LBD78_09300 [Spirochaetaceae bacterium]|nr:hypothetical protein [Spirochaetaceae bacterium]
MKKIILFLLMGSLFSLGAAAGEASSGLPVQPAADSAEAAVSVDSAGDREAPGNAGKTGEASPEAGVFSGDGAEERPRILPKPFLILNEGLTAAWITRIIKQPGRSNFVFRDFMPGLYFGMKTVDMQPLNSMIRFAAYYPAFFTFNNFPQYPVNVFRFALDMFGGINFELYMWRYIRFNLSPGFHLYFQNADRWNYFDVGVAGLAGMEFPLLKHWTLLVNGIVALDNGNLGANRNMEPFDIVYQYQLDLGFRYSKRAANRYSYIK